MIPGPKTKILHIAAQLTYVCHNYRAPQGRPVLHEKRLQPKPTCHS